MELYKLHRRNKSIIDSLAPPFFFLLSVSTASASAKWYLFTSRNLHKPCCALCCWKSHSKSLISQFCERSELCLFAFLGIFCLITLFERKLQFFKNLPKLTIFGIFKYILVSRNVNVARFARNVKWDFLGIFKHRVFYVWFAFLRGFSCLHFHGQWIRLSLCSMQWSPKKEPWWSDESHIEKLNLCSIMKKFRHIPQLLLLSSLLNSHQRCTLPLEEVADCEGQFQGECWILQAQQYSTIFSTCSIGL